MTRRPLLVTLTVASAACATMRTSPPAPAVRPGDPIPEVLFFDDFSSPSLDRRLWNVIVTGRTVNNEQQAYVDSTETIELVDDAAARDASRGALRIHARWRPGFKTPEGRAFDFTSGRIDTRDKFEFTYGTAAARIRMTAGAGLWPAFWVLGAGRWPDTGELDIMENVGDPSWTNVAIHGPGYSGNTPLVKRRPFPAGQNATGWHVYSMEWAPDSLAFKVDNDEFYRVTKADVEAHGAWAFDNPKHLIVNLAIGGAYPQGVNKVDTPYVGLPDSTVALIRENRAEYLVDWVRVTRPAAAPLR